MLGSGYVTAPENVNGLTVTPSAGLVYGARQVTIKHEESDWSGGLPQSDLSKMWEHQPELEGIGSKRLR
ncbi:hypothetical protein HZB02_01280 [Candidatus Woesearchaeota archaeon]|nr:hypothetical protein [Candidatus Woesearchaeota archaeon]